MFSFMSKVWTQIKQEANSGDELSKLMMWGSLAFMAVFALIFVVCVIMAIITYS